VEAPSRKPRIAAVANPDSEQRELLEKAPTRDDGTVRNLFLTLARHPILLKRFNAFAGTFMRFGRLPPDERELVILRVAGRTGCAYEVVEHVPIARQEGLREDEIALALEQDGAGEPSPRQALLLGAADEMLSTGGLTDERWTALTALYDEAELLELVSLVGFYRMAADIMNIVRIEPEGPLPAVFDWAPVRLTRARGQEEVSR
jgi:4-carboxymuconolactone decarboxylase